MNIIELLQSTIKEFPALPELQVNGLHTDFAEEEPDNYALSSTGDSLMYEDVVANQIRRHSFLFSAVWQAQSDFDRLQNSGLLLQFAQWIEEKAKGKQFDCESGLATYPAYTENVSCDNGMMYATNDDLNGGIVYQMQIVVVYKMLTA